MWIWIICVCTWLPNTVHPFCGVQENILTIQVKNVREGRGSIKVAVVDRPGHFLTDSAVHLASVPVTGTGVLTVKVPGLKEGTYAVSIFHDLNENGVLDTNFLGIPTEPIGFSNDARGRLGPPKFTQAAFLYDGQHLTIPITLY